MKKQLMTKYMMLGLVGAAALAPLGARAESTTTATSTTTTSTTMPAAEPTLVTGTVVRYYADRSGYVTAMDVQTANGVQMVHFPANRASRIYADNPVGGTINVWVQPHQMGGTHWTAVGSGTERPQVWWRVIETTDIDWLSAEPYIDAGAKETRLSGRLRGYVIDENGEVLALVLDTGNNGRALVRVPPEVRQIAPGHKGTERVTPLFMNALVQVVGTPEAARRGGLMAYNRYVAANSLRINGDTVGAIGIPQMKSGENGTLLNVNVGAMGGRSPEEINAEKMGYRVYTPVTAMPGDTSMSTTGMTSGGGATMTDGTTTTTTTTTTTSSTSTETATGRVMIVAADGAMLPVVKRGSRLFVQAADGDLTQIRKRNGKFVVPDNMEGARMMMVMADGRQMEMDTVNGQLMVMMADGSMAPVTLHTP